MKNAPALNVCSKCAYIRSVRLPPYSDPGTNPDSLSGWRAVCGQAPFIITSNGISSDPTDQNAEPAMISYVLLTGDLTFEMDCMSTGNFPDMQVIFLSITTLIGLVFYVRAADTDTPSNGLYTTGTQFCDYSFSTIFDVPSTFLSGVFVHLKITRVGTVWSLYLEGTLQGTYDEGAVVPYTLGLSCYRGGATNNVYYKNLTITSP